MGFQPYNPLACPDHSPAEQHQAHQHRHIDMSIPASVHISQRWCALLSCYVGFMCHRLTTCCAVSGPTKIDMTLCQPDLAMALTVFWRISMSFKGDSQTLDPAQPVAAHCSWLYKPLMFVPSFFFRHHLCGPQTQPPPVVPLTATWRWTSLLLPLR